MAKSEDNLSSKNVSVSLNAMYCSVFQLAFPIQCLYVILN